MEKTLDEPEMPTLRPGDNGLSKTYIRKLTLSRIKPNLEKVLETRSESGDETDDQWSFGEGGSKTIPGDETDVQSSFGERDTKAISDDETDVQSSFGERDTKAISDDETDDQWSFGEIDTKTISGDESDDDWSFDERAIKTFPGAANRVLRTRAQDYRFVEYSDDEDAELWKALDNGTVTTRSARAPRAPPWKTKTNNNPSVPKVVIKKRSDCEKNEIRQHMKRSEWKKSGNRWNIKTNTHFKKANHSKSASACPSDLSVSSSPNKSHHSDQQSLKIKIVQTRKKAKQESNENPTLGLENKNANTPSPRQRGKYFAISNSPSRHQSYKVNIKKELSGSSVDVKATNSRAVKVESSEIFRHANIQKLINDSYQLTNSEWQNRLDCMNKLKRKYPALRQFMNKSPVLKLSKIDGMRLVMSGQDFEVVSMCASLPSSHNETCESRKVDNKDRCDNKDKCSVDCDTKTTSIHIDPKVLPLSDALQSVNIGNTCVENVFRNLKKKSMSFKSRSTRKRHKTTSSSKSKIKPDWSQLTTTLKKSKKPKKYGKTEAVNKTKFNYSSKYQSYETNNATHEVHEKHTLVKSETLKAVKTNDMRLDINSKDNTNPNEITFENIMNTDTFEAELDAELQAILDTNIYGYDEYSIEICRDSPEDTTYAHDDILNPSKAFAGLKKDIEIAIREEAAEKAMKQRDINSSEIISENANSSPQKTSHPAPVIRKTSNDLSGKLQFQDGDFNSLAVEHDLQNDNNTEHEFAPNADDENSFESHNINEISDEVVRSSCLNPKIKHEVPTTSGDCLDSRQSNLVIESVCSLNPSYNNKYKSENNENEYMHTDWIVDRHFDYGHSQEDRSTDGNIKPDPADATRFDIDKEDTIEGDLRLPCKTDGNISNNNPKSADTYIYSDAESENSITHERSFTSFYKENDDTEHINTIETTSTLDTSVEQNTTIINETDNNSHEKMDVVTHDGTFKDSSVTGVEYMNQILQKQLLYLEFEPDGNVPCQCPATIGILSPESECNASPNERLKHNDENMNYPDPMCMNKFIVECKPLHKKRTHTSEEHNTCVSKKLKIQKITDKAPTDAVSPTMGEHNLVHVENASGHQKEMGNREVPVSGDICSELDSDDDDCLFIASDDDETVQSSCTKKGPLEVVQRDEKNNHNNMHVFDSLSNYACFISNDTLDIETSDVSNSGCSDKSKSVCWEIANNDVNDGNTEENVRNDCRSDNYISGCQSSCTEHNELDVIDGPQTPSVCDGGDSMADCRATSKLRKWRRRNIDPNELPTIPAPKRRNRRPKPAVGLQERAEAANQRLACEFPKHNWLFNKYLSSSADFSTNHQEEQFAASRERSKSVGSVAKSTSQSKTSFESFSIEMSNENQRCDDSNSPPESFNCRNDVDGATCYMKHKDQTIPVNDVTDDVREIHVVAVPIRENGEPVVEDKNTMDNTGTNMLAHSRTQSINLYKPDTVMDDTNKVEAQTKCDNGKATIENSDNFPITEKTKCQKMTNDEHGFVYTVEDMHVQNVSEMSEKSFDKKDERICDPLPELTAKRMIEIARKRLKSNTSKKDPQSEFQTINRDTDSVRGNDVHATKSCAQQNNTAQQNSTSDFTLTESMEDITKTTTFDSDYGSLELDCLPGIATAEELTSITESRTNSSTASPTCNMSPYNQGTDVRAIISSPGKVDNESEIDLDERNCSSAVNQGFDMSFSSISTLGSVFSDKVAPVQQPTNMIDSTDVAMNDDTVVEQDKDVASPLNLSVLKLDTRSVRPRPLPPVQMVHPNVHITPTEKETKNNAEIITNIGETDGPGAACSRSTDSVKHILEDSVSVSSCQSLLTDEHRSIESHRAAECQKPAIAGNICASFSPSVAYTHNGSDDKSMGRKSVDLINNIKKCIPTSQPRITLRVPPVAAWRTIRPAVSAGAQTVNSSSVTPIATNPSVASDPNYQAVVPLENIQSKKSQPSVLQNITHIQPIIQMPRTPIRTGQLYISRPVNTLPIIQTNLAPQYTFGGTRFTQPAPSMFQSQSNAITAITQNIVNLIQSNNNQSVISPSVDIAQNSSSFLHDQANLPKIIEAQPGTSLTVTTSVNSTPINRTTDNTANKNDSVTEMVRGTSANMSKICIEDSTENSRELSEHSDQNKDTANMDEKVKTNAKNIPRQDNTTNDAKYESEQEYSVNVNITTYNGCEYEIRPEDSPSGSTGSDEEINKHVDEYNKLLVEMRQKEEQMRLQKEQMLKKMKHVRAKVLEKRKSFDNCKVAVGGNMNTDIAKEIDHNSSHFDNNYSIVHNANILKHCEDKIDEKSDAFTLKRKFDDQMVFNKDLNLNDIPAVHTVDQTCSGPMDMSRTKTVHQNSALDINTHANDDAQYKTKRLKRNHTTHLVQRDKNQVNTELPKTRASSSVSVMDLSPGLQAHFDCESLMQPLSEPETETRTTKAIENDVVCDVIEIDTHPLIEQTDHPCHNASNTKLDIITSYTSKHDEHMKKIPQANHTNTSTSTGLSRSECNFVITPDSTSAATKHTNPSDIRLSLTDSKTGGLLRSNPAEVKSSQLHCKPRSNANVAHDFDVTSLGSTRVTEDEIIDLTVPYEMEFSREPDHTLRTSDKCQYPSDLPPLRDSRTSLSLPSSTNNLACVNQITEPRKHTQQLPLRHATSMLPLVQTHVPSDDIRHTLPQYTHSQDFLDANGICMLHMQQTVSESQSPQISQQILQQPQTRAFKNDYKVNHHNNNSISIISQTTPQYKDPCQDPYLEAGRNIPQLVATDLRSKQQAGPISPNNAQRQVTRSNARYTNPHGRPRYLEFHGNHKTLETFRPNYQEQISEFPTEHSVSASSYHSAEGNRARYVHRNPQEIEELHILRKERKSAMEVVVPAHNKVFPRKNPKGARPATAHVQEKSVKGILKQMSRSLVLIPRQIEQSCPYRYRTVPLASPPLDSRRKKKRSTQLPQTAHCQKPFGIAGRLIVSMMSQNDKSPSSELMQPAKQSTSQPATPTFENEIKCAPRSTSTDVPHKLDQCQSTNVYKQELQGSYQTNEYSNRSTKGHTSVTPLPVRAHLPFTPQKYHSHNITMTLVSKPPHLEFTEFKFDSGHYQTHGATTPEPINLTYLNINKSDRLNGKNLGKRKDAYVSAGSETHNPDKDTTTCDKNISINSQRFMPDIWNDTGIRHEEPIGDTTNPVYGDNDRCVTGTETETLDGEIIIDLENTETEQAVQHELSAAISKRHKSMPAVTGPISTMARFRSKTPPPYIIRSQTPEEQGNNDISPVSLKKRRRCNSGNFIRTTSGDIDFAKFSNSDQDISHRRKYIVPNEQQKYSTETDTQNYHGQFHSDTNSAVMESAACNNTMTVNPHRLDPTRSLHIAQASHSMNNSINLDQAPHNDAPAIKKVLLASSREVKAQVNESNRRWTEKRSPPKLIEIGHSEMSSGSIGVQENVMYQAPADQIVSTPIPVSSPVDLRPRQLTDPSDQGYSTTNASEHGSIHNPISVENRSVNNRNTSEFPTPSDQRSLIFPSPSDQRSLIFPSPSERGGARLPSQSDQRLVRLPNPHEQRGIRFSNQAEQSLIRFPSPSNQMFIRRQSPSDQRSVRHPSPSENRSVQFTRPSGPMSVRLSALVEQRNAYMTDMHRYNSPGMPDIHGQLPDGPVSQMQIRSPGAQMFPESPVRMGPGNLRIRPEPMVQQQRMPHVNVQRPYINIAPRPAFQQSIRQDGMPANFSPGFGSRRFPPPMMYRNPAPSQQQMWPPQPASWSNELPQDTPGVQGYRPGPPGRENETVDPRHQVQVQPQHQQQQQLQQQQQQLQQQQSQLQQQQQQQQQLQQPQPQLQQQQQQQQQQLQQQQQQQQQQLQQHQPQLQQQQQQQQQQQLQQQQPQLQQQQQQQFQQQQPQLLQQQKQQQQQFQQQQQLHQQQLQQKQQQFQQQDQPQQQQQLQQPQLRTGPPTGMMFEGDSSPANQGTAPFAPFGVKTRNQQQVPRLVSSQGHAQRPVAGIEPGNRILCSDGTPTSSPEDNYPTSPRTTHGHPGQSYEYRLRSMTSSAMEPNTNGGQGEAMSGPAAYGGGQTAVHDPAQQTLLPLDLSPNLAPAQQSPGNQTVATKQLQSPDNTRESRSIPNKFSGNSCRREPVRITLTHASRLEGNNVEQPGKVPPATAVSVNRGAQGQQIALSGNSCSQLSSSQSAGGGSRPPDTAEPTERPLAGGAVETAPHLQQIHGTCVICGKFSLYLCSSCKRIWYCSLQCQLNHWQTHSAECVGSVT